ncbi:AbiV family abortive infection protein [Bradyrhizobium sp. IC3123]|uniref:AbiV family abortive infection protein n=1 Tax=Bradyrhizobium sp. IC3123 TaxID=2793803 RepID=UPI001CD570B6|nr:AbiV family abortive infection protein [Bradyrhizobium sp. IC3123]MCA1390782.1 AbiV family abortive infection protein [Bradyrhizobium sp. IC3123]
MADNKQLSLILGNATRLLDDARLLVGHRRYASAFALALLGVDEIGKVLLKSWEAEKPLPKPKERPTAHVQKQAAVANLLVAALLARTFPQGIDWKTLDTEALTESFNESNEGQLLALIRDGHLDRRKQNALYQDDDMMTAVDEGFAEMQIGGILEIANDAQAALASPFNRMAARSFYEATVLGVSVSDRADSGAAIQDEKM